MDLRMPARRAGAVGYLTKDASAEEIEAAIRAVHRGQTWLDPVPATAPRIASPWRTLPA
jgi:DNA-binding NarL/FixJ family response regulator